MISAAHLYIISGASGSGKTTLLKAAVSDSICNGVLANKYAERELRKGFEDIIPCENIADSPTDLRYVLSGVRYGIDTRSISLHLDAGRNVFIVSSDLHVVRRLKQRFGELARALYISSRIDPQKLLRVHGERHAFSPTDVQRRQLMRQFMRLESASRLQFWDELFNCMSELLEDWYEYIPDSQSAQIRAQKIRTFHDRYIENIALFDHVILNYHKPEEMTKQLRRIICAKTRRIVPTATPLIFVVAAASGAGKGMLLETLDLVGGGRPTLIKKMARRNPKPNDRRDGMIPIGDAPFPGDFDLRWVFHGKTSYAISSEAVQRGIESGQHQIVVSNMNQFEMFRSRFPDRVVFLYLHRIQSEDELRAFQIANCPTEEEAEIRIKEVERVHRMYVSRIAQFHHVLLNTAFPEDLFDQMFSLMEHYDKILQPSS